MKKKLMLAVAAILAATSISLSSCSKDPVDKAISIYEDGLEEVSKVKGSEKANEVLDKVREKIDKSGLDWEYVREELRDENRKKYDELMKASEDFHKAYQDAWHSRR